MGFILSQSAGYFWPVTVQMPSDGGRFDKSTFEVEFKRLPQDRVESMIETMVAGEVKDREICREIVTGWKGVTDGPGGAAVQFSLSMLDELLLIPTVAMSIVKAWMESLSGAARKN